MKWFKLILGEEDRVDVALASRNLTVEDVISVAWNGTGYTVWYRSK